MSFKEVIAQLKRWFEKLNLALFLHAREFDGGRRALLFRAAALVAASALAEVPGYRTLAQLGRVRAFMPRIYVQLWKSTPLMRQLIRSANDIS
jgi:hypothetical protein